jgi:hypothetical protein
MDITGSVLCPQAGFGISCVENTGFCFQKVSYICSNAYLIVFLLMSRCNFLWGSFHREMSNRKFS